MKRFLRIMTVLAAILLIASIGGWLFLSSDWVRNEVRRRIIAGLERATGGHVTLGSFSYTWPELTVEVRDLVLRGTEPVSAEPLLRVPRAVVGLKILSLVRRDVDLQSVSIERPAVNLITREDGSTNLPRLEHRGTRPPSDSLFELAVDKFTVTGGKITLDDRSIPLSGVAENFRADFRFDESVPRYRGTLDADLLRIVSGTVQGPDTKLSAIIDIERNRLVISKVDAAAGSTTIAASGTLENFASPRLALDLTASADAPDVLRRFGIRDITAGRADFKGTAVVEGGKYTVIGETSLSGVGVRSGRVVLTGIRGTAAIVALPEQLTASRIDAAVAGGRFRGSATIDYATGYRVEGNASGFSLKQLLAAAGAPGVEWSATAAGPVRVKGGWRGSPDIDARMALVRAGGGVPVDGLIDLTLRGKTLRLGPSYVLTPASRIDVSGDTSSALRIRVESRNLDDALPVWRLISDRAPQTMPARLDGGGVAVFDGTVTGTIDAAVIDGRISATGLIAEGRRIDRASAQLTLSPATLTLRRLEAASGRTAVAGDASLALANWKASPESAVAARLTVRTADISESLKLAGITDVPLRAAAEGDATIAGTLGSPTAGITLTARRVDFHGEAIERFRASARLDGNTVEIDGFEAAAIGARFSGAAFYTHDPGDWRSGQFRAELRTTEFAIDQSATVRRQRPGLTGLAKADVKIAGRLRASQLHLDSLNGSASARNLTLDGRSIGAASFTASTAAGVLNARLESDFLSSKVAGEGEWKLEPGYPGSAELRFSAVSLAAADQWFRKDKEPSRFDGVTEGKITISGPATDVAAWKAALRIDRIELRRKSDAAEAPVLLRNEGPLIAQLDNGVIRITSAKVSGQGTKLDIAGTVAINQTRPLDLRVTGAVDLELLKTYNPDLIASGLVDLAANVRGTFDKPNVTGRLALKGASLNVVDVPNGLTNANGSVTFNGTEASIQELTAEVGGGRVNATGFFELTPKDPAFRVQVQATNVRVRYPEGVSTSASGNLVLSGTLSRSLLSGRITVLRTAFNPRTDLSSILAQSSKPILTPSRQTGPLSGLQFDVRIESSPDLSIDSSVAQGIQAEASLRLRGTPYNPVLLGRVTITEGEVTFFGTQYTIGQGTINFINPVKLEPILNLDLETRVRGIDVILTFAGPINKLTVTHRADPPLEFSEVVALLATGRAPTSDPTLAARQSQADSQSVAQLGASALIGEAIAAPVSGRLQRFFGVSKLKIDPRLTGVDNNPTARLTLEQQVTKNLTFTYITDLSRANQQIVRVEWAVSKEVSMLAIRDENGLFGVDFLYRKSFK